LLVTRTIDKVMIGEIQLMDLVVSKITETVLGYFDFDATVHGNSIRKKNRKWWYGIREDRQKDIQTERDSQDG
jgi:hypothetical protein